MLAYYAERLGTVEINSTSLPDADRQGDRRLERGDASRLHVVLRHHSASPHRAAQEVESRCATLRHGPRARAQARALLFQLRQFKKEVDRLDEVLRLVPPGIRAPLGIPPRLLVRRRGLPCAAHPERGAVRRRTETGRRRKRPPAASVRAATRRGVSAGGAQRWARPSSSSAPAWRRPTSSSSTRRRAGAGPGGAVRRAVRGVGQACRPRGGGGGAGLSSWGEVAVQPLEGLPDQLDPRHEMAASRITSRLGCGGVPRG